jgi:hypothetical protein
VDAPREAGGDLDIGEPAPVVIPTPAFVSLWNASRASAQKGLCVAPTSPAAGTLTLRNPQSGASRTCIVHGGTWERAANEARALVPAQAPEGEVVWPFKSEYWKDEIRYYSATKR